MHHIKREEIVERNCEDETYPGGGMTRGKYRDLIRYMNSQEIRYVHVSEYLDSDNPDTYTG